MTHWLAPTLATLLAATGVSAMASDPVEGRLSPVIGTAMVSGDWAYGCDNYVNCRATSLGGEEEGDLTAGLRLTVEFSPFASFVVVKFVIRSSPAQDCDLDPTACPFAEVVGIRLDDREIDLFPIGLTLQAARSSRQFHAGQDILEELGRHASLQLVDADGKVVETISLRGFDAAVQLFTSTPAPPPSLLPPVISALPPPMSVALSDYPTSGALGLQRQVGCPSPMKGYERELRPASGLQVFALDDDADLMLVPCGHSEIDGRLYLPLIQSWSDGETVLARSDGWETGRVLPGTPLLASPWVNDADGTLHTLTLLRSFGDCGSSRSYVWDSEAFEFVLVEATSMPSCRAAADWIVTYRRATEYLEVPSDE